MVVLVVVVVEEDSVALGTVLWLQMTMTRSLFTFTSNGRGRQSARHRSLALSCRAGSASVVLMPAPPRVVFLGKRGRRLTLLLCRWGLVEGVGYRGSLAARATTGGGGRGEALVHVVTTVRLGVLQAGFHLANASLEGL